jgi:hypothetical protein
VREKRLAPPLFQSHLHKKSAGRQRGHRKPSEVSLVSRHDALCASADRASVLDRIFKVGGSRFYRLVDDCLVNRNYLKQRPDRANSSFGITSIGKSAHDVINIKETGGGNGTTNLLLLDESPQTLRITDKRRAVE